MNEFILLFGQYCVCVISTSIEDLNSDIENAKMVIAYTSTLILLYDFEARKLGKKPKLKIIVVLGMVKPIIEDLLKSKFVVAHNKYKHNVFMEMFTNKPKKELPTMKILLQENIKMIGQPSFGTSRKNREEPNFSQPARETETEFVSCKIEKTNRILNLYDR